MSRTSKVGRLIDEYDLNGIGEELERRWLGIDGERDSLRDLAIFFNRKLLECVLSTTGMSTAPEDVEHVYDVLDGNASTSAFTKTKRDLEREGVDVDSLLGDFVSHQAVHTYLTDYRNVTPPDSDADPVATAERAIARLTSRTATVTETNLERLVANDHLDGDDLEVLVNVEVLCNECATSQPVGEFLRTGGCDCDGVREPLHD